MFKDRAEAGEKLAKKLTKYRRAEDTLIYALPRGGVVIGAVVAKKLHLPLQLLLVKKIGHPDMPEYAVCAVTQTSEPVCNETILSFLDQAWLQSEIRKKRLEMRRSREIYRINSEEVYAFRKTVIVVDDGMATGLTMKAAVLALKNHQAKKIIVAVPVASGEAAKEIKGLMDEIVVLELPEQFTGSVGAHFENFPQVSDEEVVNLFQSTLHL